MVNEPALAAAAASKATQLRGWIEPGRAAAALIHTHRFQTRAKCVLRGPLPALSPNSRTCGLLCRDAGTTCVCSHLSVRYSPYATSRCRKEARIKDESSKVRPGVKNDFSCLLEEKEKSSWFSSPLTQLPAFHWHTCSKKLRSDKSRYAFNGNQLVRQKRTASVRATAEKIKDKGRGMSRPAIFSVLRVMAKG